MKPFEANNWQKFPVDAFTNWPKKHTYLIGGSCALLLLVFPLEGVQRARFYTIDLSQQTQPK